MSKHNRSNFIWLPYMLQENDIVTAQADFSEKVLRSSLGVVMVYQNPSLAYEVEFLDGNG